jgi:hypothetical protein
LNYIDEIAAEIRRVMTGDTSPPELLRMYALLVLVTGERTTAENIHDAWSAWRVATRPEHRSLVPFRQLSSEVQALDDPYAAAICQVARERRDGWGLDRE